MDKQCAQCRTTFEIPDEDLRFLEKVAPVIRGKTFSIPPPKLCPDCRQQRRLGQVNRSKLYRRKSTFTGKDIISLHAPEKNVQVYENDVWWSDKWDPLAYGREADLTRPIFPQLHALSSDVPFMALFNDQNENCPYVNTTGWAKNCYLCFGADYSEDCHYGEAIYYSRSSIDTLYGQNVERCYEIVDCNNCYGLQFSQNCATCNDAAFLYDCIGCKRCFGCVGMRQKEYCYFNEKLERAEYERRVGTHYPLTPQSIAEHRAKLQGLKLRHPHKYYIGTNNEDVSGDYISNAKNSHWCFDCDNLRDCKYCTNTRTATDCYDINYWGHPGELCYDCLGAGEGATRVLFCLGAWGGTENMLYCTHCIACNNCFGCDGLRHKQYCIFNKEYTEEEYEKRVGAIIEHMQKTGEWGEFPPLTDSFYAYNETLGQLYYPRTKETAEAMGLRWREVTDDMPKVDRVIPAEKLPPNINDIPDDVLNWAIKCEKTGRPFKLIKPELQFYRENELPIPHIHPDERLQMRWNLRNPRNIYNRTCGKCGGEIQTTYAPDRPETVYCESCYFAEVY